MWSGFSSTAGNTSGFGVRIGRYTEGFGCSFLEKQGVILGLCIRCFASDDFAKLHINLIKYLFNVVNQLHTQKGSINLSMKTVRVLKRCGRISCNTTIIIGFMFLVLLAPRSSS